MVREPKTCALCKNNFDQHNLASYYRASTNAIILLCRACSDSNQNFIQFFNIPFKNEVARG